MTRIARTRGFVPIVWLWLCFALLAMVIVGVSRAVIASASAPEEDFVPTQQLKADAAVAFPADI